MNLYKKSIRVFLFILLTTLLVLSACTKDGNVVVNNNNGNDDEKNNELVNNNNNNNDEELDPDPITLTIMMWDDWGQDYEKYIKEAIEDEFPYITVENIGGDSGNQEWIEDALASQIIPDIIFSHRQYHVGLLEEYELAYDMTELLDKHSFDLSRYDPSHLNEWKSWANGELWLLPFMRDIYALQYNKDIFDVFGVDYPTDGMTWGEIIEIAEQVSGERNGIQYQGIDLRGNAHLPLTQVMGQDHLIDPDTDEVLWVESPYIKEWLEMVEKVNNNPNNIIPEDQNPWDGSETLAMRALWLSADEHLNLDMVTFPQWEDAPNIGPLAGGWGFGITDPSEHKDEAMKVLKFLYEDENIINLGASKLHAPYNHLYLDEDIENLLEGSQLMFKDTNLEALYKLESPGGPEFRSKYDAGALMVLEQIGFKFVESEQDINTFLRELKEEEEIRIQEEKSRGF